jgi:hypothetical protein
MDDAQIAVIKKDYLLTDSSDLRGRKAAPRSRATPVGQPNTRSP